MLSSTPHPPKSSGWIMTSVSVGTGILKNPVILKPTVFSSATHPYETSAYRGDCSPTGSSKTSSLTIEIAQTLHCDIISADSRQLFRDIPIGTAAPIARGTLAALKPLPHRHSCRPDFAYCPRGTLRGVDVMALLPPAFPAATDARGCAAAQ